MFDASRGCVKSYSLCATGQASASDVATSALHEALAGRTPDFFTWTCTFDLPLGAIPSGAGAYCYSDFKLCMQGPNGCTSGGTPCIAQHPLCLTGLAGGTNRTGTPTDLFPRAALPHTWLCPLDVPAAAVPNAFGALCYRSAKECTEGSLRKHARPQSA